MAGLRVRTGEYHVHTPRDNSFLPDLRTLPVVCRRHIVVNMDHGMVFAIFGRSRVAMTARLITRVRRLSYAHNMGEYAP